MPYRRLPNTDSARIRALKSAVDKAADTDFQELSFSMGILDEAKSALTHFEHLSARYQQLYDTQVKAGKSFVGKTKNARMYISHFMQVLYMCVMRSEIKEEQLTLYGLEKANMVVPDLTSNEQLLEWGQKIIDGENQRTSQGGVPIYNPSIAKVKVMFILFREGYQTQRLHQKATSRVLQEVAAYRERVDEIILEIWEEVEKHNNGLSPEKRLARNREYGIVYYYRKGEIAE
ncbi:MAG: hypothetical protein VB074_07415 [Proteiniphilum sp.]|uniref:hypothetical protein n=1 Tax=Proteiniphilum sp. TaxID=1926877 RepID=UPI00092C5060|nr:hypothetical protein [Proteiniphilum sp.]MEA5127996.1 hypothetical protein [Proteiniphilum sp.]OJV81658.1 MAG: hypothetical protein BGO34_09615 [Bacteroidia bacterium 44-10]